MFSLAFYALEMLFFKRKKEENTIQGSSMKKRKILKMRGTITRLNHHESYGLINNCIFFSYDSVDTKDFELEDSVYVVADRMDKNHIWKATQVVVNKEEEENKWIDGYIELLSECGIIPKSPDVEMSEEPCRIIIGTVSEVNQTSGKIDNNLSFSLNDFDTDFNPIVGDVIEALVEVVNQNPTITKWKPHELRVVEGVVMSREFNFGIINANQSTTINNNQSTNDDIVFFFSSCHATIPISYNQKVIANIVRSQQESFMWRAYKLTANDVEEKNIVKKDHISDKDGLFITNEIDFNEVFIGETSTFQVVLRNMTDKPISFLGCQFEKLTSSFSINEHISTLHAKSEIEVVVSFRAEVFGFDENILLFEFEDFIISRKIKAYVIDFDQHLLKPIAPYTPVRIKHRELNNANQVIIPGEKPFRRRLKFSKSLRNYDIPRILWNAVKQNESVDVSYQFLLSDLVKSNYVKKFQCLLHLEEIQMHYDIRKYDLHEKSLAKKGEYLSLDVPGLAEGRPSLIVGDSVILYPPNNACNIAYEGFIHDVQKDTVLMKFNGNFHNMYNGELYDVGFRFSRTSLRRMHHCVQLVVENEKILFPENVYPRFTKPLVHIQCESNSRIYNNGKVNIINISWQNKNLNSAQKQAVQHILEAKCRPSPYIIFGPPGTGKTVTVVEAILQVFMVFKNSKVLVCTPSNSAADLIAQRLLENDFVKDSLVRLNSYQRMVESIPEVLKPYCKDKDELEEIMKYRIIISTSSNAGCFYDIKSSYAFTHLFIDEAGQLTEPECMVPIGLFFEKKNCHIVLAGDPMQLGPVVRSSRAKSYLLGQSYMERLMSYDDLYSKNMKKYSYSQSCYNPRTVTMLIESYRSHPTLLNFFSQAFYDSKVISCFSDYTLDLNKWKNFPILFHGIIGQELREENSPSWFNSSEVVQAMIYLKKLYELGLSENDVGIITPYRKQGEKMRLLISKFNLPLCKVGSVEEFQGQERRAIIVSTVRSCDLSLCDDPVNEFGFIYDCKRFNVTISRAKELLIVIGNPSVLKCDKYWKSLVDYCYFNKSYSGHTEM